MEEKTRFFLTPGLFTYFLGLNQKLNSMNHIHLLGNLPLMYTDSLYVKINMSLLGSIKTFLFKKDIPWNILFITFGSQIFSQLPVLSFCFIDSMTERTMGHLGKRPHFGILFCAQLFCCHFGERTEHVTIVVTVDVFFMQCQAFSLCRGK